MSFPAVCKWCAMPRFGSSKESIIGAKTRIVLKEIFNRL
ncbi:MAG: hypothetical protein [Olavius algarvensis Delta 4 endosymbiont]|nr:MAG: hypothetical protein [Olavius algarvensis Delta 4 endosymbiont]